MRLHHTRIYFDGEAGNATDPALASADRPATLIGKLKAGGANVTYSLDIDPQATPRRYSSTFSDGDWDIPLELPSFGWSRLKLDHDGLERAFIFFN
jgi:hypothetical protein